MVMENLTGSFVIPQNHPSIAGHFPGHPVVPGVVLLAEVERLFKAHFEDIQILKVVQAKFNRPVTPEQTVRISVDWMETKTPGQWKASFKLFTEVGTLAASGQMLLELQV
ncbi:hypothetical protein QCB45_08250 [Thiomicrorhabdus sp. ZW0627]|uniref:hypothetical protein n=1 Tax=Thiomicrorhabdus sp. ZW0627 TaxID=3039774 RepID=UPI0024363E7E|nr:hypothetical protein [Thiomicrorhabdus sp. ZW0627]MDG6774321.1 hypothetical protein [Thiomicrorhabdus sp. ZW0627]